MRIFISALIGGMDKMESWAHEINDQNDQSLGVELVAFTHDEPYWNRLKSLLTEIDIPVSFHGPYIGVEGTTPPGSRENDHLIASYERVLDLAAKHNIAHVVYHYSQLSFNNQTLQQAKENSHVNIKKVLQMADDRGVNLVIENLPHNKMELPLYTSKEYSEIFNRYSSGKAIVDIGHGNMTGLDIVSFIKEHGEKVVSYHFHNNNGHADQHNRILDGTFDYNGFAPMFKRYTPKSNIVLEYEPHAASSLKEVLEDVDFLKEHFQPNI